MRPSSIPVAFALLAYSLLVPLASIAHPPSGIAVDQSGKVYFADGAKGIWRINDGGKLTLINPSAMHWLAIDHDGRFSNAPEEFGQWFGRLTPIGHKPTLISCSDFPCTMGKDGNLYYARMHGLTIMRRTPNGQESVFVSPEQFKIDRKRPYGVNGITCGPDGKLYLVSLDSLNKNEGSGEHVLCAIGIDASVQIIAKDFVKEKLPPTDRHPEVRPEYCRGMAVDEKSNVYVAVTGNRCVMKLPPTGEASVVLKSEKPWTPTGVDVFKGELYVLEYDDETPTEGRNWPPRVRKVRSDGRIELLAAVKR